MRNKKPMTILFDANPIAISGKSGVGHYAAYLVQALADAYPDDLRLIGHYYDFLGRKHPVGLPVAANITYHPTKLFPGRIPNMLRRLGVSIPFELLARSRGDVLLFPNFLTQPSLFRKPVVVTIHDLCFAEYPEFVNTLNLHDLRRYVPQSIERASLILAVSEFTKQAIHTTYNVDPGRIVVTPVPPLQTKAVPPQEAGTLVRELGVRKPYILFVGNLEPRKNLLSLVEAYAQAKALHDSYSLVLAGGKGWKNEALLRRIEELQRQGLSIVLPGYVSDAQKTALYQRSSLVAMPSYYEGFGMPILEAFEYGIPVAASDIPVHHEVAQDAAAYFDPYDIAAIASTMTTVLEDKSLRKRLIAREPDALGRYSWADTAERVVKEIGNLL